MNNARTEFIGTVTNVDSKDQIELFVNRKKIYDFSYSRGRVTTLLTLTKGKNQVQLKARNEGGQDDASITVEYIVPTIKIAKPKVNFTVPSKNVTTSKNSYSVTVKIENVTDKSKMDLKVNGKSVGFNFDRRRKTMTANVRLSNGNNNLVAVAQNDSGMDSDQVSIKLKVNSDKPGQIGSSPGGVGTIQLAKPVIDILTMSQPSTDPFNPNTAKTRIVGSLKNVKSKSEITLTVNGKVITNYSFNASTGRLEVIHTINRGTHTTILKLKTKGGDTQKSTSITF